MDQFLAEWFGEGGVGRILAPSFVGLVPFLINLFVNWLDKRSHFARRNAELNYVNQRVSFLMNWYMVQKEVGDQEQMPKIKSLLVDELRDVYEEFTDALVEADNLAKQRQELIQRFKNTNAFRRFLLFYTPYSASGWLYHTLYYMCLFPLLVVISIELYEYFGNGAFVVDPVYLYAGIALAIFVLFFRWLGRRAAKPVEQRLATIDRKTNPLGKSASSAG